MRIGLVTDSTSDLPVELINQYNIKVVPAIINIGDQSYEDGKGMSREEYYDMLPTLKKSPTTSSPSVGSFREKYQQLFDTGEEQILSIHPPSALSGIYNAARLAAEPYNDRVHVLDSGQLSLGLGFQVLAAAEAISRNSKIDDVLNLVSSVKQRVRVHALLDSLTYLHRSGRVSWAKAVMGGLLNLKPIIDLRLGIVEKIGSARTRTQGIYRLMEQLHNWFPFERLAVLHTNAEETARKFIEDIDLKLETTPMVVNVTTVIGTHVGPNGLGLAVVPCE